MVGRSPSARFCVAVALAFVLALHFPVLPGLGQTASAAPPPNGIIVPGPTPTNPSTGFGYPDDVQWINYPGTTAPQLVGYSGEPTLGVNWLTGNVLYRSNTQTLKIVFNDLVTPATATWSDVSDFTSPSSFVNLDPILFTDSELGRTFSGGIDPGCASLSYTDNDGVSWTPQTNPCALPAVDHETVASGPFHDDPAAILGPGMLPTSTYQDAVYYCAQTNVDQCWISYDGGLTFAPTTLTATDECLGLHGHLRIATDGDPKKHQTWEGTAYLPNNSCGTLTGMMATADNGNTWNLRTVPTSRGDGRFDPGVGISHESGWVYIGQGEGEGTPSVCACIGMSKNEGIGWEDMGLADGAPVGTKWYDVSRSYFAETGVDLVHFEFAKVVAGDDKRVAFSFLGSDTVGTDDNSCKGGTTMPLVWNYYVAISYDAGSSWHVSQVNPVGNPVQYGGIYNGQDPNQGTDYCRNLLDFYDMQIDRKGRVYLGWSDGCDINLSPNPCTDSKTSELAIGTVTRQSTGCGLFRSQDKGGNCNGNIIYPLLVANAAGPYTGPVSLPITLAGSATGGLAPYLCSWSGTGATFSSTSSCSPTVLYDDCKPHTIFLTITDSQYSPAVAIDAAVVTANSCPDVSNQGGNDPRSGGETPYPQDGTDGNGDMDQDTIPDHFDNCPRVANQNQSDIDGDGFGDACDEDKDGDSYLNGQDDCPVNADPAQRDTDHDGTGDRCDPDADNDGAANAADNCPFTANALQADLDKDLLGDVCDDDRDGDGIANAFDAFPDDPLNWTDNNRDGTGDQNGASPYLRPTPPVTSSSSPPTSTKAPFPAVGAALVLLAGVLLARRRQA